MCAELKLRGGWAKAAEAVAARVLELGAGRDSHPLTLAAAVCVLVVERHPPKEKVLPENIAAAAGLGEAAVIDSYTMDLLPHLQELLGASEQVGLLCRRLGKSGGWPDYKHGFVYSAFAEAGGGVGTGWFIMSQIGEVGCLARLQPWICLFRFCRRYFERRNRWVY
jgi:hypothetical protein